MNGAAAVSRGAVAASCFMLSLAASCATPERDQQEKHTSPPNAAPNVSQPQPVSTELVLPGTIVSGSRVPVTMVVRNTSPRPVDLYLHGREPTLDIVVTRPDGAPVWRRLAAERIQAILRIHALAAGDSLTVGADWVANEAGEFLVSGQILAESPRLETVPRRVVVRTR